MYTTHINFIEKGAQNDISFNLITKKKNVILNVFYLIITKKLIFQQIIKNLIN